DDEEFAFRSRGVFEMIIVEELPGADRDPSEVLGMAEDGLPRLHGGGHRIRIVGRDEERHRLVRGADRLFSRRAATRTAALAGGRIGVRFVVRIVSGGSAAVVGIARIVPGVVSRSSRGAGASGRAVRWLEASGARRGNPDAVVFART